MGLSWLYQLCWEVEKARAFVDFQITQVERKKESKRGEMRRKKKEYKFEKKQVKKE